MHRKILKKAALDLAASAGAILVRAAELYAGHREWKEAQELDLLAAELATHLLPPGSLGDEAAAALAVHTAKLLLKHAGRDQAMMPVEGGGGAPS
jgi:hypothetical protein